MPKELRAVNQQQMDHLNEPAAYLLNVLQDGRLELSNNRTERRIKLFVIDRKNFPVCPHQSSGQRGHFQPDPDGVGERLGSLALSDLDASDCFCHESFRSG